VGEGAEGTSTKMLTFDGSAANYQRFKLRFRAYANAKNFLLALSRPSISSAMPKDYKDTATETKKKFLKANSNVMSAYTLALEGDQVFQIIAGAMTEDWPEGLASWKSNMHRRILYQLLKWKLNWPKLQ